MKTLSRNQYPTPVPGCAGSRRVQALLLFALLLAGCGMYAQNSVKVEIIGTAAGGSCEISLGSGGGASDGNGAISGSANLTPGKTYEIRTIGDYVQATINLVAPSGHTVYINGSARKQFTPFNTGMGVDVRTVEVRATSQNNSTPGKSSGLVVGDISWGVSLGRQYNGSTAGSLVIPKAALDDALFDRGSLNYHGINGQVGVIRDSYGRIRQIVAPEVFVDVYDLVSVPGYRIDMYAPSARSEGAPPFPILQGHAPYMSFEIRRETGDVLKIRRLVGETEQDTDAWESDNGWIKTLHGELVTEEIEDGTDAENNRTETITLKNHDGTVAGVTRKTYKEYSWNYNYGYPDRDELIKVEKNPDGEGGHRTQVTEYQYHEYIYQPGSYQRLQSIKYPDGNWVYYEYYDDAARRGRVYREYRPWQSLPAAIPVTPSATAGRVIEYDYTNDWDGVASIISSCKETINGTTVSENTAVAQINQDYTPKPGDPGSPTLKLWTYTNTTKFNSASSDDVETVTVGFQPNQEDEQSIYDNLIHSTTNKATGHKVSYAYIRGMWDAGTFAESGTGTALMEITLVGTTKTPPGCEAVSSVEGVVIDGLNLVPNRSTKTVRFRHNGRIMREESHVFTGGSSYNMLAWTDYTYTESGNLESRESSNGSAYHADWLDEFRYAETTETGQHISYTPDALQRVSRRVVEGVTATADYDAQSGIATDFTYDAAGRITKTRVTPATAPTGSAGLEESTVYDLAGRAVSHTNTNGYTSSFSESTDGLTTTHYLACGGTRIVEKYLDGSTKSITGTADINQVFEVTVNTDGGLTTTSTYGSTVNGAYTTATTITDRFGRVVSQSAPGPNSDHPIETTNTYDDSGQLAKITNPGMAPTLFEYDELGALIRSGLSVTGGDTLDTTSQDRVSETETIYYKDASNHWWLRQISAAYTTDASGAGANAIAAKKITTETRTRITGFSGNLRSEQITTDAYGNQTTTRVMVDAASQLVTQTVTIPAKTGVQTTTQISYNGRPVKAVSALDETVTYHYDSLGRLSLTKPQRTAPIRTLYVDTTGRKTTQVWQTQSEPSGETATLIARYEYDDGGRVCKITDAKGAVVHRRYNCRGQLTHQWGTGTNPVRYDYDDLGRMTKQYTYRDLSETDAESGTWAGASGGDITSFDYYPNTTYLLSRTNPAVSGTAAMISYAYDDYGRLITHTNARGDDIKFEYHNKTGELKKRIYATPAFLSSSGTATETYAYTRTGALAGVTDLAGARAFAYDDAHGLALKTETLPAFYTSSAGVTRQLAYTYETGSETGGGIPGRLASYALKRIASGVTAPEYETTFTFTDGGLIDTITANPHLAGQSSRDFAYGYHADSPALMTGMTVNTGAREIRRTLGYDPNRDLLASIETSTVDADGTGDPIVHSRHDYTHDALGFRESALQTGAFFADYDGSSPGDANAGATFMRYAYNLRGELIDAEQYMGNDVTSTTNPMPGRHWHYAFDSMGNRTETNGEEYTTNALNQITSKENNSRHISGLGVPGMGVVATGTSGVVVSANTGAQGRFWSTEVVLNNDETAAKAGLILWFGKKNGAATGEDLLARIDHEDDANLAVFMPPSPEIMQYDADGNLIKDGRWIYTYDALNQLVAMETRDAATSDILASITQGDKPRRIEFAYDYLGRRIAKVVKDYDTQQVISNHRYIYQGWNVIAELDAAWDASTSTLNVNWKRSFHWGLDIIGTLTQSGGVGALLMIQDGNNQYYPAYDGNGNITGLLDNSGEAVAIYEYSPFGELLRCEGEYAKKNPFQWSTKWVDRETGLVYYGLRYYSPRAGRFINQDPISENGGLNVYGFVLNNPVNLVDVLGLACWLEIVDWLDTPQWGEYDGSVYTVYSYPPEPIYAWVCDPEPDWVIDVGGGGGGGGGGGSSGGSGGSGPEDYGKIVMMDKMIVTANRIKDPFSYPEKKEQLSVIEESDRCKSLRERMQEAKNKYDAGVNSSNNAREALAEANRIFYKREGEYAITATVDAAGFIPHPYAQAAAATIGTGIVIGGDVLDNPADNDDKILNVSNEFGHIGEVYAMKAGAKATETSLSRFNKTLGPITAFYNYIKYFNASHANRMEVKRRDLDYDVALRERGIRFDKYLDAKYAYSRECE